jgi:methylthioribose-1-phosphate isomerase
LKTETQCLLTVNGFRDQQIAGALATVGYGTALGVVRAAYESGKCIQVVTTETRPALQGARLTTYELSEDGFNVSLISDSMVGHIMRKGIIRKVLVGADRITRSGHIFNKIGTYQIALLAKTHHIPFYCVAPVSTFDLHSSWKDIEIEERSIKEVAIIGNKRIAAKKVKIFNPAFDMTPPELVTAIITEKGILKPDFAQTIPDLIKD